MLVIRCGLDGTIRYASPSAGKLLGWPPDELVGRAASELCHPDDLAAMSATAGAHVGDGVSTTRRLRCTYLWLEWTGQVLLGPEGEPELLSAGRDFSKRLAAEAALVDSQAADRAEAKAVAASLAEVTRSARVYHAGAALTISTSIGAAMFDTPGQSAQDTLSDADKVMYEAKTAGGNRYMLPSLPSRHAALPVDALVLGEG